MAINTGVAITITSGGVSGGSGGGGSGAGTSYTHDQSSPATTWNVNHALGTTDLTVAVYDAAGLAIGYDSLELTDIDNITITFAASQAGKAVVVG